MQRLFEWLTSLPPAALYAALMVTAAAENVFPPLPADTVVAFGSVLAARGNGTAIGTFLATWIGNLAGATGVYMLGRRVGTERMHRWMHHFAGQHAEDRILALYEKRGLLALFLSRFLPGVRALVPPFAGALRIPYGPFILMTATASGIWYGVITYLAYRLGADWDTLQRRIGDLSRTLGAAAGVIVLVGGIVWLARRQRRRAAR